MSFALLPLWGVLGLLAGAAALVVLTYLLRRTPRPQAVSNIAFWMEAMQRARPRFLSSRRIPLLSLLVSLIIALLIAAEVGGPRFGEGVRGTTVIVLSAGSSMGAEDGSQTRFERALDETRRWVERSTSAGEVAVIRAGSRPTILLPFTDDDGDLERVLGDLEPDDGPADLEAAVAIADDLVLGREGGGQILLVADRATETRTRSPLVLIPVGSTADSLAITALSARRDPIAVGEYAVHVEVASFTSRSGRARLVVQDRDVVVFDQAIALAAGERQTLRAQGFSSEQGEITARLEDIEIAGSEDAFAGDDIAYAVAAPLERTRVLLVTPGDVHLEGVLGAHPGIELTKRSSLAGVTPAELAENDVVVLDRVAPDGDLAHRGLLAIAPPSTVAGLSLGDEIESPRITASMAAHPALSGVRLDHLQISRARTVTAEPGDHVLARSSSAAVVVARDRGGRRALVTGFDLGSTDLVERIAFPLFIHHAVRWLGGRSSAAPLSLVPGTPIDAPADISVLGPDGEPRTPSAGVLLDTTEAGLYHVGERAIAISAAEVAAPLPSPVGAAPEATLGRIPPLALLFAAALVVFLLLEWILLHRGRLA